MKNGQPDIPAHPFADLPNPLDAAKKAGWLPEQSWHVPDDEACVALWDAYRMLENIRRHSLMVARICQRLAERAAQLNLPVSVKSCRAAGMLHDLAKSWCLRHGGSHAVLGSSWIVKQTGNYAIAQGALLHVHWPWELPAGQAICCLPIFVIYADKRVRHDRCVTLEERFDDLVKRYGQTREAVNGIRHTQRQAMSMEKALSLQLNWELHEDTFD